MENKEVSAYEKTLHDIELEALATVANMGVTIGITFFSAGFMFAGTMISGEEYYRTTIERLKVAGNSGDAISQLIEPISVIYQQEHLSKVPNTFIFLKGVKSHGGSNFDYGESLFKFKTSDISGYTIGIPNSMKVN